MSDSEQTDTTTTTENGSSPASDAAGVMPCLCIEMHCVEDRMPEEGRLILAYCPINGYRTLRCSGDKGWLDVNGDPISGHPLSYNYTHWGYLPEDGGAA